MKTHRLIETFSVALAMVILALVAGCKNTKVITIAFGKTNEVSVTGNRPLFIIITNLPAPVLTNVAAPILTNFPAPVMTNVAAPILTNIAAPARTNQIAPIFTNKAAPVLTNFPARVLTNLPAPILTNATAPMRTNVVAPILTNIAALVRTNEVASIFTNRAAPVLTNASAPVLTNVPAPVLTNIVASPLTNEPALLASTIAVTVSNVVSSTMTTVLATVFGDTRRDYTTTVSVVSASNATPVKIPSSRKNEPKRKNIMNMNLSNFGWLFVFLFTAGVLGAFCSWINELQKSRAFHKYFARVEKLEALRSRLRRELGPDGVKQVVKMEEEGWFFRPPKDQEFAVLPEYLVRKMRTLSSTEQKSVRLRRMAKYSFGYELVARSIIGIAAASLGPILCSIINPTILSDANGDQIKLLTMFGISVIAAISGQNLLFSAKRFFEKKFTASTGSE